jgi:hypothetical protein
MAKLILTAYPAQVSENGGFGVVFDLTGAPPPLPAKVVEIKRAAEATVALEAYKAEAAQTGKPIAISMRIADGDRSPNGFKALQRPYYHKVNA